MFELFDGVVREAVAFMGTHCNQMMAATGGNCGKDLEIVVVNRPNQLSDRTLVGTCPEGHYRLISIIDDKE